MKPSIIDQPRLGQKPDLFDIDGYQQALSKFICNADTPITIALQGEWGSGKTSLMNSLQYNLSEKDGSPFYHVLINIWQYSMLCEPEMAIISILRASG